MKKIILILFMILGGMMLYGNEVCTGACDSFSSGFYGGVRIGGSRLSTNNEVFSEIPPGDARPEVVKVRKTFSNFGVHFGYLCRCCGMPFVLAPEIFLSYSPSKMESSIIEEPFLYRVKTQFSFGGNIRAGGLIMDSLLIYGFFGVVGTSFVFEAVDNTINYNLGHDKKFASALNYGVGIEHEMMLGHRIRLELGCVDYRKVNFSVISNDRLSIHQSTIQPKIHTISLMYSVCF